MKSKLRITKIILELSFQILHWTMQGFFWNLNDCSLKFPYCPILILYWMSNFLDIRDRGKTFLTLEFTIEILRVLRTWCLYGPPNAKGVLHNHCGLHYSHISRLLAQQYILRITFLLLFLYANKLNHIFSSLRLKFIGVSFFRLFYISKLKRILKFSFASKNIFLRKLIIFV